MFPAEGCDSTKYTSNVLIVLKQRRAAPSFAFLKIRLGSSRRKWQLIRPLKSSAAAPPLIRFRRRGRRRRCRRPEADLATALRWAVRLYEGTALAGRLRPRDPVLRHTRSLRSTLGGTVRGLAAPPRCTKFARSERVTGLCLRSPTGARLSRTLPDPRRERPLEQDAAAARGSGTRRTFAAIEGYLQLSSCHSSLVRDSGWRPLNLPPAIVSDQASLTGSRSAKNGRAWCDPWIPSSSQSSISVT